MTQSCYERLLRSGVKIYEYKPGFIHAKCYLTDDEYAMIGTINLDYRSLAHHFENGVWMYKCSCLSDIRRDFDETFDQSIRITEDILKRDPPAACCVRWPKSSHPCCNSICAQSKNIRA